MAINKLNDDLQIGSTKAYYIGDSVTDGSWRFIINEDNLEVQKRVSGNWVTKQIISG